MSIKKPDAVAPHTKRPLRGSDIIQFQGRHDLDKDDVSYYLALPSFKKKCAMPQLDYPLELLMRLFDENPTPPPFKKDRISIVDLFNKMYGKRLAAFKGTEYEIQAKVDFQNRFSKLLGRSKGRAYRWLDESAIKAGRSAKTSSDILGVLGKLTQCDDPGETLERLGKMIWGLRGEDIDELCPIPTLKNPPKRGKRGRRPGSRNKEHDPAGDDSKARRTEKSTRKVVVGEKIRLNLKSGKPTAKANASAVKSLKSSRPSK